MAWSESRLICLYNISLIGVGLAMSYQTEVQFYFNFLLFIKKNN